MTPITRFAPSPTGHLHIGGARTALFCWAYARRYGGRFVLRIEDTDQARSSEASTRGILEDLAWLGIAWDDGPEYRVRGQGQGAGEEGAGAIGGDARGVGPFEQSRRLDIYNRWIDWLIERDLAYPAFDTTEEVEAKRKAAAERKETFRYIREASYDRAGSLARMRAGEMHVVRFRHPGTPVHVTDAVLGAITFEAEHTDDFVLRKADGFPTYHFAVVIDDELMAVTHILRGQEHLNNTPRHVALQLALKHDDGTPFRIPVYAHLPLIFNPDGSKMSKRDKDKAARAECKARFGAASASSERLGVTGLADEAYQAWIADARSQLPADVLARVAAGLKIELPEIEVEDFRRSGYLPEVVCNYIALLGWNPGMKNPDGTDLERFDMAFLAEHFDLDRIGKTNSKFDRAKLAAFNQDSLAKMAPEEFAARFRAWCGQYEPRLAAWEHARFAIGARAAQPRAQTFREAVGRLEFALMADDAVVFDAAAVEKVLKKGEPNGLSVLGEVATVLEGIGDWRPEVIEGTLKAWAEAKGLGMGKVAQPLRVAITGSTVSPGLGDTLALVGKQGVLERVLRCVEQVG
ncbi:MAG: glutamate--tRNA ligase [Phycisphaeraceae bacterium]|nr:glutamate--tRNA ligase [Phycisphaeraceae bacterium]